VFSSFKVNPWSILTVNMVFIKYSFHLLLNKGSEATDIDQHLYARFEEIGLPRNQVRRDIATAKSGQQRGDLWVSRVADTKATFEDEIVALIECKDQ
jgi:hypothetical protein